MTISSVLYTNRFVRSDEIGFTAYPKKQSFLSIYFSNECSGLRCDFRINMCTSNRTILSYNDDEMCESRLKDL